MGSMARTMIITEINAPKRVNNGDNVIGVCCSFREGYIRINIYVYNIKPGRKH